MVNSCRNDQEKNALLIWGMEYQQWLPLDAPFEKDILQHIPAKLLGHD